jgi:hypothetical protein
VWKEFEGESTHIAPCCLRQIYSDFQQPARKDDGAKKEAAPRRFGVGAAWSRGRSRAERKRLNGAAGMADESSPQPPLKKRRSLWDTGSQPGEQAGGGDAAAEAIRKQKQQDVRAHSHSHPFP